MNNQVSPYLAKILLSSLHLLDALKERDALKAFTFYQSINLYNHHRSYNQKTYQGSLILNHKEYILDEFLSNDTNKI